MAPRTRIDRGTILFPLAALCLLSCCEALDIWVDPPPSQNFYCCLYTNGVQVPTPRDKTVHNWLQPDYTVADDLNYCKEFAMTHQYTCPVTTRWKAVVNHLNLLNYTEDGTSPPMVTEATATLVSYHPWIFEATTVAPQENEPCWFYKSVCDPLYEEPFLNPLVLNVNPSMCDNDDGGAQPGPPSDTSSGYIVGNLTYDYIHRCNIVKNWCVDAPDSDGCTEEAWMELTGPGGKFDASERGYNATNTFNRQGDETDAFAALNIDSTLMWCPRSCHHLDMVMGSLDYHNCLKKNLNYLMGDLSGIHCGGDGSSTTDYEAGMAACAEACVFYVEFSYPLLGTASAIENAGYGGGRRRLETYGDCTECPADDCNKECSECNIYDPCPHDSNEDYGADPAECP